MKKSFLLVAFLPVLAFAAEPNVVPVPAEKLQQSAPLVWETEDSPKVNKVTSAAVGKKEGPGHEVKGGGTDPVSKFKARAHFLLQAMYDYNALYADDPKYRFTLIPETQLKAFERALDTNVYPWQQKPLLKGEERDAGVFDDPARPGQLAIAIHAPTFADLIKNKVNFDELIIHEYGLAAGLRDEFYMATGPVIAQLQYSGLTNRTPTVSARQVRARLHQDKGTVPVSRNKTRRVYFTASEELPAAMAVFFGEADSEYLVKALGPDQVVVEVVLKAGSKMGSQLFSAGEGEDDTLEAKRGDIVKFFLANNATNHAQIVLGCVKKATGSHQCAIWQWLNEDNLPAIIKGERDDKSPFLRIELPALADSKVLFDRMLVTSEPGEGDAKGVHLTYLLKSFVSADGQFAMDCFRYYGTMNSYACAFETELKDVDYVVTAEPSNGKPALGAPLYRMAKNAYSLHQSQLAELKKARSAIASQVETAISERRRVHNDIVNRAVGAYSMSRSYSPFGGSRGPGSDVIRAMFGDYSGPEILQIKE